MGYKSDAQRKAVHASPYMMYGKKSGVMMSESPLAKYGCSKKYKKGK